MTILSFLWYNVAMLLKSIFEKINTTLGRLSPARRIFLSFALVIFLGSLHLYKKQAPKQPILTISLRLYPWSV